jgi:hypothetical protein
MMKLSACPSEQSYLPRDRHHGVFNLKNSGKLEVAQQIANHE